MHPEVHLKRLVSLHKMPALGKCIIKQLYLLGDEAAPMDLTGDLRSPPSGIFDKTHSWHSTYLYQMTTVYRTTFGAVGRHCQMK